MILLLFWMIHYYYYFPVLDKNLDSHTAQSPPWEVPYGGILRMIWDSRGMSFKPPLSVPKSSIEVLFFSYM